MKTKRRDITKAAFLKALDKHGIGRPEFLGYCTVRSADGHAVSVSYLNALGGSAGSWRNRLAYLLSKHRKES
jgi:hypothetical protein